MAGNYKDRHFNVGSLLLAFGVMLSLEGAVNTFMRTGKLYPGPHLYVGGAITLLWALAAALVSRCCIKPRCSAELELAEGLVGLGR